MHLHVNIHKKSTSTCEINTTQQTSEYFENVVFLLIVECNPRLILYRNKQPLVSCVSNNASGQLSYKQATFVGIMDYSVYYGKKMA